MTLEAIKQAIEPLPYEEKVVAMARQHLEGDRALELEVFGLVDHTHAAGAELRFDAVMAQRLADHGLISFSPALSIGPTSRGFP